MSKQDMIDILANMFGLTDNKALAILENEGWDLDLAIYNLIHGHEQ